MGTSAIIKVLGITLEQPNRDTPLDLASLTYNVQHSAIPFFRQDISPMSETDRLMHACSDNMFPLALPPNVTSATITDFSPIRKHSDGYPQGVGRLVATFCCETCPHIINGMSMVTPYNSANGVGDFHIQLASYLKDENTNQNEFINRGFRPNLDRPRCSYENPRCGGVASVPQNKIRLNVLPNANVQNTDNKEKLPLNMTVDYDTGTECDFVYTVIVYQWNEFESQSAIRIIVNDSEAMTPAEFKNFCEK